MKLQLKLVRDVFEEDFTLSSLYHSDGRHLFYICEDAVREVPGEPVSKWKVHGQTAIPRGNYKVVITFSNRFQKHLPLLLDVPGFEGIRIHAGNSCDNTEGCLLPGLSRDAEKGLVLNSKAAMAKLQPMIQNALATGKEVWLEVI